MIIDAYYSGIVKMNELDQIFEVVARNFRMLSEPTRLRILHAICREEKCVSDIIAETGVTQTNASRHLRVMHEAGMLARRREGSQIFYRVADQMYLELCRAVCTQVAAREEPYRPRHRELQQFLDEINTLAAGKSGSGVSRKAETRDGP